MSVIRLGHHRRFTTNHTMHLDLVGRRLLLKVSPNRLEAAAEIDGHARLRGHYPVPALRARVRAARWTLHAYDRFGSGLPGHGLLLDEINRADRTGHHTRLNHCLDDILGHYRTTLAATTVHARLSTTISKLYGDRARPGGRLDRYYRQRRAVLTLEDTTLCVDDLAGTQLLVNTKPHTIDFRVLTAMLRSRFDPDRTEWAAITQGDPTDLNIGWTRQHGPTWFDFDTAGLNTLAGEFACFLWYQHLHGGWIVPTYNPAAFADHPAALQARVLNEPTIHTHREHTGRIAIDYHHAPSPARQHTIGRYLRELVVPTAASLGVVDLLEWLRPWLAMRILAVFNLGDLSPSDAALHLAYLTEVLDPDTTLDRLLAPPPTGTTS